MIPSHVITRLREAVDLQALAAEYVTLRKAGPDFVAKCPFHTGDDTASCRIHKHTYYCFGCNAHGSAIDWIMGLDGVTFTEACRVLSERTGIDLDDKPVTRKQQVYEKNQRAFHDWWWKRTRSRLREKLDAKLNYEVWPDEDDPDMALLTAALMNLDRLDKLPAERTAFIMAGIRDGDYKEWQEDAAWDKRIEDAFMSCALLPHDYVHPKVGVDSKLS